MASRKKPTSLLDVYHCPIPRRTPDLVRTVGRSTGGGGLESGITYSSHVVNKPSCHSIVKHNLPRFSFYRVGASGSHGLGLGRKPLVFDRPAPAPNQLPKEHPLAFGHVRRPSQAPASIFSRFVITLEYKPVYSGDRLALYWGNWGPWLRWRRWFYPAPGENGAGDVLACP